STLSKEYQKQLSRECQKRFRNKNRETRYLFTDTSEKLQYLLNTEVPIVVVETGKTPIIDTDSGSDSDDLSPLSNIEVPTITNLEFTNTQSNPSSHRDIKPNVMIWMIEKDQNSGRAASKFSLCCANSKVQLPPLLKSLLYLLNLYTSTNSDAVEFRKHARSYNNALAFYHLIGSLLPNEGHTPAFAQIYIYDTANEITNHHNIMQELNENILQSLQNMLDICNPYIQNFCQVRDIICDDATTEILMIICGDRNQDICRYNAPSAPDVAAIMVDNGHEENMENPIAHIYTYVDFPSYYTWNSSRCKWTPRKTLATMIGATSFDDLKTINVIALKKLALILVFFRIIQNEMPNNHKIALCEDILYRANVQLQDLDDTSDIPATIEHEALT
ncbi:11656_t:CDS:2, partial [Dentiscutata erythropus]